MAFDFKPSAQQILGSKDQRSDNIGTIFKNTFTGQANIVQPGDESLYPNSPRNFLVDRLGLPDSWRQSTADEKRYWQDLPMNMGMAGITAPIKANVGATAAEALGGAAESAFDRLALVEKPQPGVGSVTVKPGLPVNLGAPSQGYLNMLMRNMMKNK